MRFGTALSIPSVFTAVTNCWCSSADHTTRGFFNADESSWPSSFGSAFPFKLLPGGNSTPVVVVARGCFARALLPGFLAGAVRAPGAAVGARRGAAFRVTGSRSPRTSSCARRARPSSDPSDAASASPDPRWRRRRPRRRASCARRAADVAQLLDAHGLEQIVHGAVDDPAQHHVRGAVGAHHHHRHIELERDVLQRLNPSMSGMCTSESTMSKSRRRSRSALCAAAPRVKVVTVCFIF